MIDLSQRKIEALMFEAVKHEPVKFTDDWREE